MKCYTTEHPISRTIMPAFARGCDGQMVPPIGLLPGPAAMYGILRGTERIIKECENVGRTYFYLDHGYVNPSKHNSGDFSGHYRIVRNGRQRAPQSGLPPARWEQLGRDIRPWYRRGRNVVVTPPTEPVCNFYGIHAKTWLRNVIQEVAEWTDRPVVIKKKGEGKLDDVFKDCWCLITHSSNTAVDALLSGIPIITLGESACEPLSWSFGHIENPYWPEREGFFHGLAWEQWTLSEMSNGAIWEHYEI